MWRITMWSVIVAVLLTSAGWLYYGLKREARREEHYKQEQALLRAQHKEDLEAISALSAGLGAMREGYESLDKDRGRLNRELQRVKKDAESNRYLSEPVPSGVRDVLKNSQCLQLPGSCNPDKAVSSGVPGDTND
jgi:type II secretory pathway pseudopilin PulG